MRRLVVLILAAFLLALPGQAQMRGGFHAGGFRGGSFHGGFGGRGVFVGHAPFGGGVHVSGGVVFGHNPRVGVFFGSPFFGPRFHRRVFFSPFFPHRHFGFWPFWSAGFGYYGYPGAYPYYPYSYPYPDTYDAYYSSAYDNRGLQNEVADLQAEVRGLQDQQDQLLAERARERAQQSPAPPPPSAAETPHPATILVFRDGKRLEVQSYAIIGQTLWILSEQRSRKIPLSDLDLDATVRLNEQRGVEFPVPEQPKPPQR